MGKMLNDEGFKHVHYNETNLQRTFARVRKQQAEVAAKAEAEVKACTIEQDVKLRVLRK
jgi:hypothetical protein